MHKPVERHVDQPVTYEISYDDFSAYMPQHTYIFRPTGEIWNKEGVNARIPPAYVNGLLIKANAYIDSVSPVEQMTWWPGEPVDIKDKLVMEGGWIEKLGVTVFNQYRPPNIIPRRGDAGRWVNHVRDIYGDYADHIIAWCAHRVQRPGEKINHCIVLGGEPGIGKDSILEPVKHAIGGWNFREVSPVGMLERFNPYLKAVILRISEAHDRGEGNRFAFHERTKTLLAAPPNTITIDEKNIREHLIPNVVGVIMTSNHKDALYLPANDRRHYVAWSDKTQNDFDPEYWNSLYHWYEHGGFQCIAWYLNEYDLTEFDPKAPPVKTPAFWDVVNASSSPENIEFLAAIEACGSPDAITVERLRLQADGGLTEWLNDRKNRKAIPHRFGDCGYTRVSNPDHKQGLYRVNGSQVTVYAKSELSLSGRYAAVDNLR